MDNTIIEALTKLEALRAQYDAEWPKERRDKLEELTSAYFHARQGLRLLVEGATTKLYLLTSARLSQETPELPSLTADPDIMNRSRDRTEKARLAVMAAGYAQHEKMTEAITDLYGEITAKVGVIAWGEETESEEGESKEEMEDE